VLLKTQEILNWLSDSETLKVVPFLGTEFSCTLSGYSCSEGTSFCYGTCSFIVAVLQ
jgi:hypothetical protein